MIQFQPEDHEVLARLSRDRDFQHLMDRLESEKYRIAMDSMGMDGTPLYRHQGAAKLIESIIEGVEKAPKTLERIKEKFK